MQFDVAIHRLEHEFGAPTELSTTGYTVARRTDQASAPTLRAMRGVDVLSRADGTMLAIFESRYWLDRLVAEQPDLTLDPLVAGELAG
jgi:peptide chain release factor 3